MHKPIAPLRLRLLLLLMVLPLTAHAYIDMGTGAYLVQALLAVGGAVVLFVRHPIDSIKAWWKRRRGEGDE